ncbi:hypothetical protein Ssi03_74520 [Sphaerisporangium siamense]|uniref:S-DNA-T family DNA segregation ATPase FtsK/SpoIIIE n=1 Tax=Sphaerisporangium siamense TaxID=795645 RepID=A0A7W7D952_9ACTN|nr:hypothetical protein [Sphaerisporangium siamense]MBB4702304.1 S-DNA-T family DNA segregation ATPase FtsK/SpoIIIE [Sphaerisporangium siamense]GII89462.1 hypothetical protein Ssi03_74520 [Sphaerisporangium siamense]
MSHPDRRFYVVRDGEDAPPLHLTPASAPRDHEQDAPGRDAEPHPVIEGRVLFKDDAEPGKSLQVRIVGSITRLPRSERARAGARGTAGVLLTVAQGVRSWIVRAYDAATFGVHRRQIRAAEAAGDREALAEWIERKQRAQQARHTRLADLPGMVVGLAKLAGAVAAGTGGVLLVVSIGVGMAGVAEPTTVFAAVFSAVRSVFSAVAFVWPAVPVVAPLALALAAYLEGRRVGALPRWISGSAEEAATGRDVIPDEGAILNALRNLEISALNKAFRGGWRPRFVLPTERDGKGYRTQVELPPAVTVEMIVKKKPVLAHNLVRFPVEVWPTEPRNLPGVLDLWVADQGALTGPVPPWPLLTDGVGDYFKGVPVAMDIRGKTIIGRLFEANYGIAGMMGSGKSTLIITALLGALLDPLVDADVFVMAVNADYDPMKPRLRTLMTGTGEEVVEACLATLRDMYDDLNVRGKALQEHGARAVTRELAEKDARLRPRIIVIDECQALFMHEEYGAAALEIAVKLESAARKYAVTLIFATPEPSSASLPRRLMAITSNKACFAIGDQTSNDAILGTGSYTAGISAVGLEPKTDEGPGDVGTFMARGFTAKPGLLRGYYVTQAEAGVVVERALRIREKAGVAAQPEDERDLLEDLAAVLGGEMRYLADLPALLSRHAPRWAPYARLSGKQLREQLAELGVKVPSTGNKWPVYPDLIREALALRAAQAVDGAN